jgi:RND family efflux transporter MFP subunit
MAKCILWSAPASLCLLLFIGGCNRAKPVQASNNSDVTTVAVAKVGLKDLSHGLVLTAEFRPFQEIDVMAKVAGYVKKMYVDAGDRVTEGQLLAVLEIPEMADDKARAVAAVARANAEVTKAQQEFRRAQVNYQIAHLSFERLAQVNKTQPGLVAQQEVDDAQSKDLSAQAQEDAAKSSLVAAEQQVNVAQAEQARVKTMFNYTQVTAPFAGVITKRFADTGSMIQAGISSQTQAMPLVRLSQNSLLRLVLPVPESVVPTIRVGSQVEVRVPSLSRSIPGRVVRFADRVKSDTRTMDTEVDVPNANLTLVPGMYAEVDLTLAQKKDAIAVPIGAVDVSSESNSVQGSVFVVTNSNQIEKRPVTIGLETADSAEIKSGLQQGELVVVGNRAGLLPGQKVSAKLVTLTAQNEK